MYEFKANIAVMLNITPDHADRCDCKMDNYVKAKFRIIPQPHLGGCLHFSGRMIRQCSGNSEQIATEARLFPLAEHEEHHLAT